MKYNILILSFLIFLSITCINVYAEIDKTIIEKAIFNEMRPVIVSNNSDGWEIKGLYFNSILKERADSVVTWRYEEKGKKIGFMHQKTAWDTGLVIAAGAFPSKGVINSETTPIKVTYDDAIKQSAFGTAGINVEIIQDNYRWQKIIEIESLESLDKIPANAEYLEISFLIFDDFKIQNGIIEKPILFGENSYLQPVRAWDSSEDPDDESGAVGVVAGNVVTKRIPVAWLKTAVYPVRTDFTITFGAENVFNSASTDYISVDTLDSTRFVVAYKDNGGTDYGIARVGEISGNTITSFGAESIFSAETTNYINVGALDNTHFVVVYSDSIGINDNGTARVGEISGTTITSYGAKNVYNIGGRPYYNSIGILDSDHFILAYKNDSGLDYGIARVGEVSGTTITSYGAKSVFTTTNFFSVSIATLNNTHFIIAIYNGTARVGEVSGTTITSYGAYNAFHTGTSPDASVARLTNNSFVIVYRNASSHGYARVGEISGTTITSYGTANVFNTAITYNHVVSSFDSTHFIVGYRDFGGDDYGIARVGEVSGTTITSFGAENIFNAASTILIQLSTFDNHHFGIVYRDVGNSNYGTAIIGSIPEMSYTPPNPLTLINTTGNFWVNHTWAAGSGNVTDSYNVSVNDVWHNTSPAYYNDTYAAHAWQNTTVWAYNSTGTGTLSSGSVGQDTQIPNNPITITNTSDWSGDAGETVYVDYDATDADSDTATFSCDRTDLFTDFDTSTGTGNWTATANIYYVDFGVSDGYGSISNYTMTLTESSVEITLLEELKLIMSEITTGLKSINMGNYLVYAFILIGILLIILGIQIITNNIYRG